MSRILGLDYGDKRVGLALGESGHGAFPYKVLSNDGRDSLLQKIRTVIREENIALVVVGLPYSLSGVVNERLQKTKDFVDFLRDNLSGPVQTVDERLTSKLYSRQGISKDIDKHAATAILDTYLEQHAQ